MAAALLLALSAPCGALAAELVLDFRGGKVDRKLFRFDTKEAFESFKQEPDGLRVQYVPGKTPNKTLGIAWNYQVRGDFVVTARYEILAIEKPAKGNGVGVELYLMLDDPGKKPNEKDGIPLTRLERSGSGSTITIQQRTTNADGNRVSKNYKTVPTTADSERGRLRLARQGSTMIASFALGDAEEFQELKRFEIGTMDVTLVRFAGMSGGDPNASMDMRLLEFRLQADEFGKNGVFAAQSPDAPAPAKAAAAVQEGAPAPAGAAPTSGGDNRWLLWGSIVGGVVVLIGVLAFVFRRPRAAANSAPAADANSASMIALVCPGCVRKLKVKNDLAGKRVKCPHCGASVPVLGAPAQ
jgi:hypothetical protein